MPNEPINSLHFSGEVFSVQAGELTEALLADLKDCGAPGDAVEAVDFVLSEYAITGDPVDCASWLYGYGAWEAVQLMDHRENLRRVVWLAGSGLREQGEAYFEGHTRGNDPEFAGIAAKLIARDDEPGCEP